MKKFNLILLFTCLTLASFARGPICRTRSNGTLGIWFRVVEWDAGSALIIGNGELCLKCHTPGNERCIPSNAGAGFPNDYDSIDREKCLIAFEYIDQQVEAKNFEGTYQIVVQVEGENFKRVYNATWKLGEKGEGNDRFWRTDVTY